MIFFICHLFLLLLPSFVFSIESCSLNYTHNLSTALPDQAVCKKNETYTIIEVDPEKTGAKCLDGSNYKFFLHKGSGEGKNKFLFYFTGAGYCGYEGYDVLYSCYERSQGEIGSSNSYGSNGSTWEYNKTLGYASSDPEVNPLFWNWNIFYLPYCDGTNAQGYLENPVYYNNTPLWVRGFNNTMAVFDYAREKMNSFEGTELLLCGASSGGTAAMVWASYLQDYFPKNVKMYGLSDGGIFLDIYSKPAGCHLYRYYMQNLAIFSNATANEVYRRCKYRGNSSTSWKCMLPQYMYKDVDVDFFIANSQYDVQQLSTQLGTVCLLLGGPLVCNSDDLKIMTNYREKHFQLFLKIKKDKPSWGFWLRSCFEHIFLTTWAWYGNTMNVFGAEVGNSLSFKEAFYSWYNGGKNLTKTSMIDILDWKHNSQCVYDELYRNQDNSTETQN